MPKDPFDPKGAWRGDGFRYRITQDGRIFLVQVEVDKIWYPLPRLCPTLDDARVFLDQEAPV